MGQKISPTSLRLPLNKRWSSRWFASKDQYSKYVVEDAKIRNQLIIHYGENAGIAEVIIKRNPKEINLEIHTSKPGVLIGRQGAGINGAKKAIEKLIGKSANINIVEIKKPDINARVVAENIGNQITRRFPFRRAAKQAIERAMQSGAKGIKVIISGRLNGAEIARSESSSEGAMPSSTLNKDIDFAIVHAKTTYGIIGVKVWIYKGDLHIEEKYVKEKEKKTIF